MHHPTLQRLILTVPEGAAEIVSALLMALGLPGFERRAAPGGLAELITWLDVGVDPTPQVERGLQMAGLADAARWALMEEDAGGWVQQLAHELEPIRVGPLLIRPATEGAPLPAHDPEPGVPTLRLTPGRAFGAGTHPTTRICLEALVARCAQAPPAQVVDVGCGTGILALAALRLGAARAWGVDIEPGAVRAARDHAALNGLVDRSAFTTEMSEAPSGDLVIANITPPVLTALCDAICATVAPEGQLWLSGVRPAQASTLTALYADHGLRPLPPRVDAEGWHLLRFAL